MKNLLFLFLITILFFASCRRKNVPQRTVTTTVHPKIAPDRIEQKQYIKRAVVLDSAAYAEKRNGTSYNASFPTVVINGKGVLQIDAQNLPPNVSHNLDALSRATPAFTQAQADNLMYRFKEIPPRVLLVPDNLAVKGVKGYYYQYENKFWYWKRQDGYFYLDKNYYQ